MHFGSWWLAAASVVGSLGRRRQQLRAVLPDGPHAPLRAGETRVFLPAAPLPQDGAESLDVWGFADTRFTLGEDGAVTLSGRRYALAGRRLPALRPWVESVMDVALSARHRCEPHYPPAAVPAQPHPALDAALAAIFADADQITQDFQVRLRHGHGHTQEEMYALKHGSLPRIPDRVVYPASEAQVEALVRVAREHGACLIPYGGGTSVTAALRCPADETRPIISVDMQRMHRVLWIDPVNRTACIEAGAVGRHLGATLQARGFTMGHEPDSAEFSTLGGWIATHASGMKKNRYGNIEDLVVDMTVVGADGVLRRHSLAPRESVGSDPRHLLFGSEGALGIITSATVKLFDLPEVQRYGSVLFPSFASGVAFMYELAQSSQVPASVRLVDNLQFQLGMALKPEKQPHQRLKSALEKFYVTRVRGLDPQAMAACTLVFEGTAAEVALQETSLYRIAARHGGLKAGADNGRTGYQLTFGIAYIRDFVMDHYILAESFETSVPWSQALALVEAVKARVRHEHAAAELPGRPFITARVTQIYPTGVCVYFYLAFCFDGVKAPSAVFEHIEAAARETILEHGGSLSHHHGVGKLRQRFLPQIMSPTALAWRGRAKRALDPDNVFGCGNQPAA